MMMPKIQSNREFAASLVKILRQSGFSAYFVGGCVRDKLLGLTPKDHDICTSATPTEIKAVFSKKKQRRSVKLVGAHFGVVMVGNVEVATYRSETSYSDGRHPDQVVFETTPIADVQRRDFTVNALLEDPETGEILDFVCGLADLNHGIIRTVGPANARFKEDKLRMLRAVRFATRFQFNIARDTWTAITKAAHTIHDVSQERIRDELSRMLTEGNSRWALSLLKNTGLLKEILPEVAAFVGCTQPKDFHPEGDVWDHTMRMMHELEVVVDYPTITQALGVLLHDVGKPATLSIVDGRERFLDHVNVGMDVARQILTRLKYPNAVMADVIAMVENHMKFYGVMNMRLSTLKTFLGLPNFRENHLLLHYLDCFSAQKEQTTHWFCLDNLERFSKEELKPVPLITGDDLIVMGYKPGPLFKKVLADIYSHQLEGVIVTLDQAKYYALTFFHSNNKPIDTP